MRNSVIASVLAIISLPLMPSRSISSCNKILTLAFDHNDLDNDAHSHGDPIEPHSVAYSDFGIQVDLHSNADSDDASRGDLHPDLFQASATFSVEYGLQADLMVVLEIEDETRVETFEVTSYPVPRL